MTICFTALALFLAQAQLLNERKIVSPRAGPWSVWGAIMLGVGECRSRSACPMIRRPTMERGQESAGQSFGAFRAPALLPINQKRPTNESERASDERGECSTLLHRRERHYISQRCFLRTNARCCAPVLLARLQANWPQQKLSTCKRGRRPAEQLEARNDRQATVLLVQLPVPVSARSRANNYGSPTSVNTHTRSLFASCSACGWTLLRSCNN